MKTMTRHWIFYLWLFAFLFFTGISLHANSVTTRAGYLTINAIGGNTYQINSSILISGDPAPTDFLRIEWGDGNDQTILLDSCNPTPYGAYYMLTISGTHIYSPGQYSSVLICGKRVQWIRNIPSSDTTSFVLFTSLVVDPNIGANSRPNPSLVLLDPAMSTSTGNSFGTNVTDADGDSLSWQRILAATNYQWPETSGGGNFNLTTQFTYDWNPSTPGLYTVVFQFMDLSNDPPPNTILYGWSTCEVLIDAGQSVSTNNMELQVGLTVFPDPSSSMTTFRFTSDASRTIIITDYLGRIIWSRETSDALVEFPAHEFANGMYFYQVESENESTSSGKFVIQH